MVSKLLLTAGNSYSAVVSRDGDALVATITGIAAKIGVEGGKLIENWTAGGQTLTRTSSK